MTDFNIKGIEQNFDAGSSSMQLGENINLKVNYKSIFSFKDDGDSKVTKGDIQHNITNTEGLNKAAKKIWDKIMKFFDNNNGKEWTEKLKNKLFDLITKFNSKVTVKDSSELNSSGEYTDKETGEIHSYKHTSVLGANGKSISQRYEYDDGTVIEEVTNSDGSVTKTTTENGKVVSTITYNPDGTAIEERDGKKIKRDENWRIIDE